MKRIVAVNERGCRIGEDHQRAKLSNHEVDLMRELRDAGWSYGKLSEKFEVTKMCAWRICTYQLRAQSMVAYKAVS